MTLQEAMNYRGENPATLSDKIAVQEGYVRRWCKPGGLMKLSAARLQQLAQAREMRDMVFRVLVNPVKRKQEQRNREKHQCGAGRKG